MFPTPSRVLIICTRRIGDVLLATPVIHSCREAWHEARIDVLVFQSTAGVLQGNRSLSSIIAVPDRSKLRTRWQELIGLWRRYDLALSLIPSDRARIYGWAASKRHFGTIAPGESRGKSLLLDRHVVFDDIGTHTISIGLQVAALAGIRSLPEVVNPSGSKPAPATHGRYAVLHPYPKFNYKMWTQDGWITLVSALKQRGFAIFLTGSNDPDEVRYCEQIASNSGGVSLAGRLSLAETADLLREATVFVGPDTAVTHMAAAAGTPTVALFGPSNPVKWGPWPRDRTTLDSPWPMVGSGRQGNVYLLQGEGDCVPCRLEGCDRHVNSFSRCLQELPLARVLAAVDALLGTAPLAAPPAAAHD